MSFKTETQRYLITTAKGLWDQSQGWEFNFVHCSYTVCEKAPYHDHFKNRICGKMDKMGEEKGFSIIGKVVGMRFKGKIPLCPTKSTYTYLNTNVNISMC